ncbi:MAG: TonB-dependent receptor [Gammaproteobacteria bacterium]|nr:TonB-dependent receptor [Gammaproteobacteria bacterium]
MNSLKNYVLAIISVSLFSVASFAQEIEEIIVTANKREQTVQDIPMNISVLTSEVMTERGIYNPEDYLRTLAGVSTPGGDTYYTMRGLNTGTAQVSSGTSNTYMGEISMGMTNLYDVNRIEVLRGPQGTLYGSNAVGGTIRYITAMPQFDEFEGNVTVEAVDKKLADDTGLNYNFMVNVPFSENFAMRAVYTSGENPGIYQNVATGRKDIGTQEDDEYRLMFRYQNGPLDINAMVMKRERYDFGQKEKGNADKPGTADIVDANCSYDTAWYYGDTCSRVYATAGGDLSGYDPSVAFYSFTDETFDVESTVTSLTAEYDFETFTAMLILADYDFEDFYVTDWSRIDTDDLYPDPLYYYGDAGRDTQEIRLSSTTDGPFQWTVGYFSTEYEAAPNSVTEWEVSTADGLDYIKSYMGFTSHNGTYDPSVYRSPYGDTSYRGNQGYLVYGSYNYYNYAEEEAIYASLDYTVDKWTFTVGMRDFELSDGFKTSEYGIFYESADNTGCDGTEAVGATCSEENGKESDNRFKYTVAYEVDDDLTLFAVSSVGYRAGGNNAALPFFCANDPEAAGFKRRYTSDEAENTEIGVKSRGDNYTLNATYFWVDWTGIQVTVRPACGWSFTYNGGEAETSGVELDFSYDISDNLVLDLAGSFISAEISNDIASLGASAGDRLPNIAEEQLSMGLSYRFEMFNSPAFARADFNYYGESYATFAEDREDMSPSYTQVNFNLGMEIDETSRVQLSVSNLTDERSEAFRFSAESPSYRARNYLQWIPPRTIALSYSRDF